MSGLPKRVIRFALVILPVVTVGLGTWGACLTLVQQHGNMEAGRLVDVFFESLAYLGVEGFAPLEPGQAGNTLIRTARFAALLWVVLGVASIINAIAGYLTSARFWLRAKWFPSKPRSVDLVCGLGWHGLSFINDPTQDNSVRRRMLAMDPAPSDQARADCRRNDVPLLAASADRGDVLDRIDLTRLSTIFIATGSDDANMRIVFKLARRLREVPPRSAGPARLICTVHLADTASYAALFKALPGDSWLDLRIFNYHAVTARELYRTRWLDRFAGLQPDVRGAHLVLCGDGAMADELLLQALQLNHYEPSMALRVDVLSADAVAAAASWRERYPCYARETASEAPFVEIAADPLWEHQQVLPRIRFHDLPHSARGQVEWCEMHCGAPGWVGTTIVAQDHTVASAAIALNISGALHAIEGMELWVYVSNAESAEEVERMLGVGAGNTTTAAARVHVFSAYPGQSRRAQAMSGDIEDAARRVNRAYGLKVQGPAGQRAFLCDQAGIDRDWFNLREADRNSSRQAASHAWVKDRITRRLGEAPSAGAADLLAEVEHRRWCAQQLLDGMRPLLQDAVSHDPAAWSARDRASATIWFGSRADKDALRNRKYHIDLLSFADLACLDALDSQALWGSRQQDNDRRIASLAHYIVTGELPQIPA